MGRKNISRFLIAAPKSNSGKTMLTLGLMHALVNRGLKVQPFKCGPDYIDPMHHSKVAGKPSYNLDLWMASAVHVKASYHKQIRNVDVAIVEGVMGLFDGAKKDEGSSAAITRTLDLPVVLVVDASSVAYSVAPLLFGFKHFDKNIKLAGVIFNKVASVGHFQFLKEASADAGVDVLGYVPRDKRLHIESRHLGLYLPGEHKNIDTVIVAAKLIEEHVDIDLLLKLSESDVESLETLNQVQGDSLNSSKEQNLERHAEIVSASSIQKNLKIALANDEAFNFSYRVNRDNLNELGEVKEFSPINDTILPDADLLWLPGGYPELFAKELAENKAMKTAIKNHVENGKALIAECGGMMYLGKNIITKKGESFEMTRVFDIDTSFENMKLHLGYRELSNGELIIRGHEFHYSNLISRESADTVFEVQTARGKTIEMPVFRTQNCWASYMHLYLGEKEKMQKILKELGL